MWRTYLWRVYSFFLYSRVLNHPGAIWTTFIQRSRCVNCCLIPTDVKSQWGLVHLVGFSELQHDRNDDEAQCSPPYETRYMTEAVAQLISYTPPNPRPLCPALSACNISRRLPTECPICTPESYTSEKRPRSRRTRGCNRTVDICESR